MPTVRTCCCGCSLRTGTLILLWLGAISTGFDIIFGTASNIQHQLPFPYIFRDFLIYAIILSIHIMGIYGTEKERPSFLKPYLGLLVFSMVSIIIAMVLLPLFTAAILRIVSTAFDDKEFIAQAVGGVAASIFFYEIIFLLFLALVYYFFIVVVSFYKELQLKKVFPQY